MGSPPSSSGARRRKGKPAREEMEMGMDAIPKGYRKLEEVYTDGKQIVVIEWPEENDENHNCDALGCSSLWHVKYRAEIPMWQRVTPDPDEAPDTTGDTTRERR